MTKEEAINLLSQMRKDGEGFLSDNTIEAYDMAIEALEQEPCDDAISRQAVLDLPRIKTHNEWGIIIKESVDVKNVRQLPSVSTEKTGHWVHWASGDDCSECGWSTGRYIPTTKYCPNCGAKMEVENG